MTLSNSLSKPDLYKSTHSAVILLIFLLLIFFKPVSIIGLDKSIEVTFLKYSDKIILWVIVPQPTSSKFLFFVEYFFINSHSDL